MIIKILSVISMLLGGVLIFLAMCSTPRRVTKMNIEDKIVLGKHVKSQRVLNVIVGVYYFIMGLLLVLELIPAKYAAFYILLIILFEKVAGFRIGKRFETLN